MKNFDGGGNLLESSHMDHSEDGISRKQIMRM